MTTSTLNIDKSDLSFTRKQTYLLSLLFVIGNLMLPQLTHAIIANGGPTLLPIYFFTLLGSMLYGWRVGILTALCSPIVNSLMFGMPHLMIVPLITCKSLFLAITTAYAVRNTSAHKFLIAILAIIVAAAAGGIVESVVYGSVATAAASLKMSLPGLAIQAATALVLIKRK